MKIATFANVMMTAQDIFLALVIWACIDPSNVLVPPPVAPVLIAFA
jgi:hypothetical protein